LCINLSIYLFMRKCIIFDIAFGKMHDLLDWEFYKHLSLILGELFDKVIGLLWFLKMLYHWCCCLRYVLETFKCFGNYLDKWQALWILWMLNGLIKLFGNELCIFIMLTCELFLLFYPCAVTIVIIRWLPVGCRLPVGLTKLLVETQLTCGPNEAPGRITTYLWA
jgi:hypothetical protein